MSEQAGNHRVAARCRRRGSPRALQRGGSALSPRSRAASQPPDAARNPWAKRQNARRARPKWRASSPSRRRSRAAGISCSSLRCRARTGPAIASRWWATPIIPAVLIGLVDVRRVKTTNMVAALTARMGIGNRFEIEARVPYLDTSVDTVSREILTGSAQDNVFNAEGRGSATSTPRMRYQFNRGDYSKPFWIGWLRYRCAHRQGSVRSGHRLRAALRREHHRHRPAARDAHRHRLRCRAGRPDLAVCLGSGGVLRRRELSAQFRARRSQPHAAAAASRSSSAKIAPGDIFGFNVGMGLVAQRKGLVQHRLRPEHHRHARSRTASKCRVRCAPRSAICCSACPTATTRLRR